MYVSVQDYEKSIFIVFSSQLGAEFKQYEIVINRVVIKKYFGW